MNEWLTHESRFISESNKLDLSLPIVTITIYKRKTTKDEA